MSGYPVRYVIRQLLQPQPHILKINKITLMLVFVVERGSTTAHGFKLSDFGPSAPYGPQYSLLNPLNPQAQKFYELKKRF